jgi:hypothetical protein
MSQFGAAENAKARAVQAQMREIEAQRRAVNLLESSAILFDRAHQPARSQKAKQRAERVRLKLWRSFAELDRYRQAA